MAFKSFKNFLAEKGMPYQQALDLLGLKAGFTKDELKAAYKKAAFANHPDRGGSTAKMQDINVAFEVLDKTAAAATSRAEYQQSREDHEAKRVAFLKIARDEFAARWRPELFTKHFATVFGEPFTQTVDKYRTGMSDGVYYTAEWANATHTTVMELSVYISISELFHAKTIASPDSMLRMSITTEILHNRKKVKLSNKSWQMSTDANVLVNPDVLFPAAKMKTQAKKEAKRKLSKRDVLLTFEKELGASVDYSGNDVWVRVPVGDYKVLFYRNTMTFRGESASSWGINGIYKGTGRVMPGPWAMFRETESEMHFLWDELRKLQRDGKSYSEKQIHSAIENIHTLAKSRREA